MIFDALFIGFLIAVGAAVLLFELSMLRTVSGKEAQQKKHLQNRLAKLRAASGRIEPESLLRDGIQQTDGFSRWFGSLPFLKFLRTLVAQSGQSTTVAKLLLITLAFASVTAVMVWVLTRHPLVALGAAVLAGWLPIFILAFQRRKRVAAFNGQLAEAMDIITRALRAGHTLDSALQIIGEELPAPISDEFAVTSTELSFGVPPKVAFNNLLDRVPSKPLKTFVTSILIQRETGGNLAEILSKISVVIRASYRFQRKLLTLSAEARLSALVLGNEERKASQQPHEAVLRAAPRLGTLPGRHVTCAPCVSTYTAYSEVLPVMNRRFRLVPPKQTLLQISGSRICPIRSPLGAKTCTPS